MNQWFKSIFVALVAVFAPIKGMILTMLALVLADLITGIWAAYKSQQPITSAKLRTTVTKLLIYLIAVCIGYLTETYLLEGLLPISKLIAGAVGLVELTSLLENANKILGQNLFKMLIDKLGSANKDDKNGP